MMNYGGQTDPRGGGVMATADVFERKAIRDTQISMHRNALSEQAFLDPWRENYSLFRGDVGAGYGKPKVSASSRRIDIPGPVMWLRDDDGPESDQSKPRVDTGPPPSGASHPLLGTLALSNRGRAGDDSRFFDRLTAGNSEEDKRQFLITNERHRRHADKKQCTTDTLGLGCPLPHRDYHGGYIPTGPKYRSGKSNPWPKLAVDSHPPRHANDDMPPAFDPWTTSRWGGVSRPNTTDGAMRQTTTR